MKGKLKFTTLAIVLIAGMALATSVSAISANITVENESDIIVDKNGNGDYTTIQEAINNAPQGSTIYVKIGEYPEIIEINKAISLHGEEKDSTLINPVSENNKYAIRLGAPGVTISGFSITNGAPGLYSTGIRIIAENIQISDCEIYNTPVGIAIWSSGNNIDNCIFYGCKDEGIAILGSSYKECNNNEITNCKFYDNCDGIELQYSSGNIIDNCEIYDNTHAGIDAIGSNNDDNIITNCRIYNNEVFGIYLSSSSDNQITDCYISENNDGNVEVRGFSANNEIAYRSNDNEGIISRLITILRNFNYNFVISLLNYNF
jgi:parallel beta-helix repeat protein